MIKMAVILFVFFMMNCSWVTLFAADDGEDNTFLIKLICENRGGVYLENGECQCEMFDFVINPRSESCYTKIIEYFNGLNKQRAGSFSCGYAQTELSVQTLRSDEKIDIQRMCKDPATYICDPKINKALTGLVEGLYKWQQVYSLVDQDSRFIKFMRAHGVSPKEDDYGCLNFVKEDEDGGEQLTENCYHLREEIRDELLNISARKIKTQKMFEQAKLLLTRVLEDEEAKLAKNEKLTAKSREILRLMKKRIAEANLVVDENDRDWASADARPVSVEEGDVIAGRILLMADTASFNLQAALLHELGHLIFPFEIWMPDIDYTSDRNIVQRFISGDERPYLDLWRCLVAHAHQDKQQAEMWADGFSTMGFLKDVENDDENLVAVKILNASALFCYMREREKNELSLNDNIHPSSVQRINTLLMGNRALREKLGCKEPLGRKKSQSGLRVGWKFPSCTEYFDISDKD